ncbi:cholinesterase 1-like [Acanthaster planci]|uniref:Carboxylic ester hydrolase n=1 Tax=Acanthaster planci TaxID=133434 RepID=A0A8B7ZQ68_ACAPL|nr:cholinesterase 1-like [Acanthaster planci]
MAVLIQVSLIVLTAVSVDCQPRVALPGLGTVVGETVHYSRATHPVLDTTVDIFRGIPYAEKPARFAKPQPKVWSGEWDATNFKDQCVQPLKIDETSEDCLYLNIWAPSVKSKDSAVMVFFHGGGYVTGAGDKYNGLPLVAYHDVIYVSCNYRLNSFGFISTGDPELPGNYGLWDQVEALKWVKKYISEFGGDPSRITIFGQSAGGGSVSMLTLGTPAWEFYNRAIAQSGSALSPWVIELDQAKARQDAFEVGRYAGCNESRSSVELATCLREVEVARLRTATTLVIAQTRNVIPFVPVVDGEFITDSPANLLDRGEFKKSPFMTGTTRDEGTLLAARAFLRMLNDSDPFVNRTEFDFKLSTYIYSYTNDLILDAVRQQYVDWATADDPETNFFETFVSITTDEPFVCPTDAVARTYAKTGADTYMYHMTHVPSERNFGERVPWTDIVAHSDELLFVFGFGLLAGREQNITAEEVNMTVDTMRYWTNFAKTGNPNMGDQDHAGSVDDSKLWARFTIPDLSYKELAPAMGDQRALRSIQCHFWNDYLPQLVALAAEMEEAQWKWREEFYNWRENDMAVWRQAYAEYTKMMEGGIV